jgi:hypothetical protein
VERMMGRINGNPGTTTRGRVAFANGERSWTESFDVLDALTTVLSKSKHAFRQDRSELLLLDTSITLIPGLVGGVQPLEKGGVRTVTTVEIHHPVLLPRGVFEYQHATGEQAQASIYRGLDAWVESDLVAILDALRETPATCNAWLKTFPETSDSAALKRRIVFGPVTYYAQQPTPEKVNTLSDEHAGFCTCCLLTKCWGAFEALIAARETFAIRFYAMRDSDGAPAADCRVNGVDYEAGKEALRRYVRSWPARGVELRKQYVVVHSELRNR